MEPLAQVNYFRLIKRRWSFITVVTLIVLLLSLVVTLVQPFQYRSEVKILIIQRSAIGIDAYSASKSAERIGRNLAQIIYSSDFFSKVLSAGYGVDRSAFPADEEERRKEWQRRVVAEVPAGTTILEIQTFHQNRDQATKIAQAIAFVLIQDASEYVGVEDIDLKVVDEPLTSTLPVKPNFLLNALLGLAFGFLLALAIVLVRYSEDTEAGEVFRSSKKYPTKAVKRAAKKQRKKQQTNVSDQELDLPSISVGEETFTDEEESTSFEEEPQLTTPEIPDDQSSEPYDDRRYADFPEFEQEDTIRTLDE